MPDLEHWTTWKERCALGLCPEPVRKALQAFAHARFFKFAAAYARATNTRDPAALTPPAAEAWHRFEVYLQVRNSRAGKSYKQWLFERAGSQPEAGLDCVQGGATLLMRDVVRDYLCHEVGKAGTVSLDGPPGASGDEYAPSLHELLPAPLDTREAVMARELETLAGEEARRAMDRLDRRQRVALLARQMGLALSHPAVVAVAECGKSILSVAYREALLGLAQGIRSRHPEEDAPCLAQLTVLAFHALRERILLWGKSEIACARLFYRVEGR